MGVNTLDGDFTVRNGTVNFSGASGFTAPPNTITDAMLSASSPAGPTKTRRRFVRTHKQANGASIVTVTERIHLGYGAIGAVTAVRCMNTGVVGTGGGMSVTVDVKKNGVSILTAVMTINAATLLNAIVAGSIATAAYAVGDYFDVVVTATAGGGTLPQGLYVDVVLDEDPS
jgi:hypothetical protein